MDAGYLNAFVKFLHSLCRIYYLAEREDAMKYSWCASASEAEKLLSVSSMNNRRLN